MEIFDAQMEPVLGHMMCAMVSVNALTVLMRKTAVSLAITELRMHHLHILYYIRTYIHTYVADSIISNIVVTN